MLEEILVDAEKKKLQQQLLAVACRWWGCGAFAPQQGSGTCGDRSYHCVKH
jgi:hypothetical protein